MEREREGERERESLLKHVCKLCNKKYPNGKSLGGHMRSHVMANSNKNKLAQMNKAPIFDVVDDDDGIGIAEVERENVQQQNNSGYGLRENPKKSWRIVENQICKQCGKGFQSLKALCGHMSSHSDNKDRNFRVFSDPSRSSDDHSHSSSSSSSSDDDDLDVGDENPNPNPNPKRVTRSSRYRQSFSLSTSNTSEIDQLEQEEVAISLMMLSRDSSSCCYSYSAAHKTTAESSDNNSVILEGGSSSNYHGVGVIEKNKNINRGTGSCYYIDKIKNVRVRVRVGGCDEKVNVNVAQEMDNSDSGYFENGAKELESDDSNNYGLNHKPRVGSGSGIVSSYDDVYSKKRIRDVGSFNFDNPEFEDNSSKKNGAKRSKIECMVCKKTFETHQALASHIIIHRKNGNDQNKISTNNKPPPQSYAKKGSGSKKIKGHKCPYCPRVFKSGQALGGHKRSHMMGGGGGGGGGEVPERRTGSPVPRPEPEQRQPMIDLNLPAPLEEEGGGSSQFVGSW